MLVSVVIAPLSFCSFPPHYICQRRLFFFFTFLSKNQLKDLSLLFLSNKWFSYFYVSRNMVPPPPRFPLPFTLHLLLVPCIGGTSRSPRGWQHWAGRHQRSWLEKPGAQEPAWFSLHSRDPWPSVSGLRPHRVNACSNTTPAGSRRFLVLQLNLRCHRYYFPPTTARTNICSVSAAHI